MDSHTPKPVFDIAENDRQLNPRLPYFCDTGTGELCREILKNGGKQIGPKPRNSATEMDVFSIQGFSDRGIEELIKNKIGIDINIREGRNKIQALHTRAIQFYEEELFRVPGNEAKKQNFSTKKSIIDFIKKTAGDSTRRQTVCNIIKIMFVIAELDGAENLQELDKKAENAIREYFLPHIQILDSNGFPKQSKETKARITIDLQNGGHKVIDFKLRFRQKASRSSILKMLYNPEYGRAELIADAIGMEFDCKSAEDIILVQSYFDDTIYSRYGKNIGFTDKHIYTQTQVGELIQNSGEGFQERIQKIHYDKKPFSGKGYRDFKCNVELPVTTNTDKNDAQKKYTGFEIRGVIEDNRNNSGLNDGRIYEQSKRIHAMIRLQGYVTESYVKKVINKFYEIHSEVQFSAENLLEKFLSDLKKIYFGKKTTIYYTTPERFETLSQKQDLYPKGVIEGK